MPLVGIQAASPHHYSQTAWWKQSRTAGVLEQRLERFRTPAQARALFAQVQVHLRCQQCHRHGGYTRIGRRDAFRLRCSHCQDTLSNQRFRAHLAQEAEAGRLTVNLESLIADVLQLTLRSAPDNMRTRKLSTRRDLDGLLRSTAYATAEDSLLQCCAAMLEQDHGDWSPGAIKEAALGWLRKHPEPVSNHLGTVSQPAADALLEHFDAEDTVLMLPEEILLLHGVAGAFEVAFAHLKVVRMSYACQIIPLAALDRTLDCSCLPTTAMRS